MPGYRIDNPLHPDYEEREPVDSDLEPDEPEDADMPDPHGRWADFVYDPIKEYSRGNE